MIKIQFTYFFLFFYLKIIYIAHIIFHLDNDNLDNSWEAKAACIGSGVIYQGLVCQQRWWLWAFTERPRILPVNVYPLLRCLRKHLFAIYTIAIYANEV